MEPHGVKPEKVKIEHIDDMHQRAIKIWRKLRVELPDIWGKYFRDIFYLRNPSVLQYLEPVVKDKTAGEGVEIGARRDKNNNDYKKKADLS